MESDNMPDINLVKENLPNLGNDPYWNNTAILLTILTAFITFILLILRNRLNIYEFLFCRRIRVLKRGYYTDDFLKKHIKKAKSEVKIFCVRNIRISEPDIIKCFREFCDKGGALELFVMNSSLSDEIIEKIMVTLPTEPESVEEYKKQVEVNKDRILKMKKDLGMKGEKVHYYEYDMLPTIHLCLFDSKIYLGYQIFDSKDDKKDAVSLGDYCSVIKVKSPLGKLILEQIDYLRKDKLTEK